MRLTAFMAASLCAFATVGCTPLHQPAAATTTAAPSAASVAQPAPSTAAQVSATGIQGAWTGQYQSTKYPATHGIFHVTFTQSGNAINGTISVASDCAGQGTVSGSLSGNTISFGVVRAEQAVTFDGILSGNTLRGNYHSGPACGDDAGTWTATRS